MKSLGIISSPYSHGDSSLQQVMMQVVLALIPAIGIHFWIFGWGIITNIVLAVGFCLGLEAIVMWLRRRPIKPALFDGSALVTAMLLAITIPPLSSWWLILVGSLAAIVFANWDLLPEWYMQVTMWLVASVIGVKKVGDYLPGLISAVKEAVKK